MDTDLHIETKEVLIESEQKALLMYDRDSDDLEIIFERAAATCAVDLTDNIVLRFDRERAKPLSLILISVSRLIRAGDVYPLSFSLDKLNDLPPDLRTTVLHILTTPPVNHFLHVSYLYQSPTRYAPITHLTHTPDLMPAPTR